MKIIVTGSLGHISKPLTKELVQKGHQVTVISSAPKRQQEIEALGAIAAIGSLEDPEFLNKAFTGADAVYTMVPPFNFFDPNADVMGHCINITNNYASAIEQADVKRVVHLSSIGAHMDKDSGLILAHHEAETILSKLSDVAITFMRPTAFYYNLYGFLPTIKNMGVIASNYGGADKVAWVSPTDIAAAIVEELETPGSGRKIRYVASDELSCNEAATILGEAIGKPDLQWIIISDDQLQEGLLAAGIPASIVKPFVEMNASMHAGALFEDYYQNRPALGKVKMTDFAKEFAVAFKQS